MLAPSRLRIARKRQGLTLTDLARETELSRRSLSAYENGKQQPTQHTLACLAAALHVAPKFLTGPDLDEIPPEAVSFRAMSKITARQRDRALAAGRIAIELNEWIEARFTVPAPNVPSLTGTDPEIAAEMVRAHWGVGQTPIKNMVHLLEANGVRVFSLTGESAELDAYALHWRKQPYVFLNTGKSSERARFDCAHECGHLVLHSGDRIPNEPGAEAEADRFAAAFLMPRAAILSQRLREATIDHVLEAKRHWNVSAMALTRRLFDLDLLTDWRYRSLCVQLSQMGYRRAEPDGVPRETSMLLTKVFAALREDGQRPSAITDDLGLSATDLHAHVLGLTMVALTDQSRSLPHEPSSAPAQVDATARPRRGRLRLS
ncbi:ImmA/IrrE family metallo-endopeptidase [Nocardia sp. BMG111209]|uniref:helix-turn-helix domain-containing protein n=1 Tax=Nocardia sp. BMG111209 TaxID=1160137 RepID=UPI0003773A4D|nr:XRE family transcriptional regulator [Nocardia sp. BMG111209]